MEKIWIYRVDDDYIKTLRSIDSRVQYNKNKKRPYVGVVLQINGMSYYVPMESPKPSHAKLNNSGPIMRLDSGKLGILGFNNMIPVPVKSLIHFDINAEPDAKYRGLLLNQLAYIEKHWPEITNRAFRVYKAQTSGRNPFYQRVCCDFRALEQHFEGFKSE